MIASRRSSATAPLSRWPRAIAAAKSALGVGLLAAILWWACRQGFLLTGVGWGEFAVAALGSIVSIGLNAEILAISLRSLDIAIPRRDVTWLTAVGSLGNALGGLPIGTGVKFALLVKRFGMPVSAVFWTYFFYSVVNASWMMMFGAVIAVLAPLSPSPALPLVLGLPFLALVSFVAVLRSRKMPIPAVSPVLVTLIRSRHLARGFAVSGVNVLTMLLCFSAFLFARTDQQEAVAALLSVTIAVPLGFLTGLPSLGGIQELLLGAVGTLFHLAMAHGIQLGLVMRGAGLVAASLLLLGMLLRRADNLPGSGS